ncbi:MAG: hypothetical protein MOB07_00080 [Acidobacteria bacterium]|nr:hypothetical protein [Acidobacteriota bacterium]
MKTYLTTAQSKTRHPNPPITTIASRAARLTGWLSLSGMRTATICFILGVAIFLGAAAPKQDGWKKIENSSFSFSVPSAFKKTKARGIDSFVEEYVTESIKPSFDYGMYSNNFGDWPKDTEFENIKVNGKDARIGAVKHEFHKGFPYSTQIPIKLDGGIALSMFAACKSEKEVALARKIFETISF